MLHRDIEVAKVDSSGNLGSDAPNLDAYLRWNLGEAVKYLEWASTLGNAQLINVVPQTYSLESRHAAIGMEAEKGWN
jgi:hypothetical protein